MSKLPLTTARQMAKILEYIGFRFLRQRGSHAYFIHPDGRSTVVPFHKGEDLRRGLIRGILKDIDLSIEDYELLRKKV